MIIISLIFSISRIVDIATAGIPNLTIEQHFSLI